MENKGKTLLWNVEQAAAALAISPWTIRAYIRQGRMMPVRIGRRILFEPDECQRFLTACKKSTSRKDSGNQLLQHPIGTKRDGVVQA
jgi:excisionase family DNA binding protein